MGGVAALAPHRPDGFVAKCSPHAQPRCRFELEPQLKFPQRSISLLSFPTHHPIPSRPVPCPAAERLIDGSGGPGVGLPRPPLADSPLLGRARPVGPQHAVSQHVTWASQFPPPNTQCQENGYAGGSMDMSLH
ncbi:hypothetical protein chiPu_0011341 [Chiloscyllium punctatum]|uniref:Uncharacterized protein n=1 Tax=Chiloscyllium punctatum TaxID=137246 RepID=A0A401SR65_CHIPU|nr:hypothetical protein [Chiloscyllium punctatum]